MAASEPRWRHLALLISILLLFTAAPFVVTHRHGVIIQNVLSTAVLVAGSYALSERKRVFLIAILLSALSVVGTALVIAFPETWALLISHSLILVLIGFFCVTILRYVLRRGRVNSDKIFAAICVYMLMGYGWSFVYSMLVEFEPHAFVAATEVGLHDFVARLLQLRYFSFTTLTTVGYGDIVPHSALARTLTVLEAVMGQFYLVVLVGRLVGLHIVHGTAERSP
jgi:hypothetical protein